MKNLRSVDSCFTCRYSEWYQDSTGITCLKSGDYHDWDMICDEWEAEENEGDSKE